MTGQLNEKKSKRKNIRNAYRCRDTHVHTLQTASHNIYAKDLKVHGENFLLNIMR